GGAPITDFVVQVQLTGASGGGFGGGRNNDARQREETRDDQGRFFVVGLREGTWRVSVRADEFVAPDPVDVAVPQESSARELAFVLGRGASVAGVVKDSRGAIVAAATVTVASPTSSSQPAPWMRVGGANTNADEPRAESDGDGAFVLTGLKPGK